MNGLKNQSVIEKKKVILIIGVVLVSALSSFWMLPSMTLRSHECFVSVTAREMLQNHDYIWPTMNGVPRIQKTPLCYWLVAGIGKLTGNIDELSTRLPSALFAFLSAIAVLFYLNRWLSLRIAAISAAVWSTSLAYIRCSHRARPDMVMAFFIILCMLSFYSIVISKDRRQQVIHGIIFWVSFALANLAKGPAPIAYVLIPIAVYIIISKQWHIVAKMLPFVGSFIFLAIVLPWLLFISDRLNWDLTLWKHEYFDRLFGNYAPGNYPIYYYLTDMFKYITPWVVFLPIALAAPFYKVWGKKRPVMMYMWIWFIANIVFLTIDAGKRQHYILPLIPPMTILIGIVLNDMFFFKKAYPPEFIKNILVIHVVVLILLALIAPVVMAFIMPYLVSRVIIISLITLIGIFMLIKLLKKNNPPLACVTMFASIIIFVMATSLCFSRVADIDKYSKSFALKIASIVPRSDKLVAYFAVTSKFVQYYDNKVVPVISDISELRKYYDQGYWIVCRTDGVGVMRDNNFRIVYYRELKGKGEYKSDDGGALINKFAPVEKFEYINNSQCKLNTTVGYQ